MNLIHKASAGAAELIGPAAQIAARTLRNAHTLKSRPSSRLKTILHGPPGTGKTTIANLIAAALAEHAIDIESINGRNLTIDVVRDWQRALAYGSLFGGWKVKVINEVDLAPQIAQDLMLTYLDELPPCNAVIATSNASMETLTERFATRFGPVKIAPPTQDEIAALLRQRFRLTKSAAQMIAAGSCGNVRDALLQAETWQIVGAAAQRPERPALKVVCAAASERAKRAWDTMRTGKAVAA
jgi:putative ATPase